MDCLLRLQLYMTYSLTSKLRAMTLCLVAAVLSACAAPTVESAIVDPNEVQNRAVHDFNLSLDRALFRPASNVYGHVLPVPVQRGIANVAANLNIPGDVVNNVLQVRFGQVMHNSSRFVINSTIGIFGLFDVATAMGLPARPTDFGETLYYWRVPEGPYVEMPIAGPATTRHTVGRFVDLATNPVSILVASPDNTIGTAVGIADAFGSRYRNSDLIDSVLYESADSYAQSRLLYLQNRRFRLRGTEAEQDYLDPYEDPYNDSN
jgi:phospholipid-binding lipoprotein MlaA